MPHEFSEPVAKIVENYLSRFQTRLQTFPEQDRDELIKEIHSHIYESYMSDSTENEVERIFNVLNKLGEPDDVIAARIPDTMVSLGKKKNLPLYILASVAIALFGIPLGLGGAGILFGLIFILAGLALFYYTLALSLTLSGCLCAVVTTIRIINPNFLDPYISIYPLVPDPTLNLIIYLVGSLIMVTLGIRLLWSGKYFMGGFKFLIIQPFEIIKENIKKRRLRTAVQ